MHATQKYRDYLRRLDELLAKSAKITGQGGGIIPAEPVFDRSQIKGRKQTRLRLNQEKTIEHTMAEAEAVHGGIADWLAELAEQDF